MGTWRCDRRLAAPCNPAGHSDFKVYFLVELPRQHEFGRVVYGVGFRRQSVRAWARTPQLLGFVEPMTASRMVTRCNVARCCIARARAGLPCRLRRTTATYGVGLTRPVVRAGWSRCPGLSFIQVGHCSVEGYYLLGLGIATLQGHRGWVTKVMD